MSQPLHLSFLHAFLMPLLGFPLSANLLYILLHEFNLHTAGASVVVVVGASVVVVVVVVGAGVGDGVGSGVGDGVGSGVGDGVGAGVGDAHEF